VEEEKRKKKKRKETAALTTIIRENIYMWKREIKKKKINLISFVSVRTGIICLKRQQVHEKENQKRLILFFFPHSFHHRH
jgi:predicted membrane channel-forming protein YqfA (hemolysin III family)